MKEKFISGVLDLSLMLVELFFTTWKGWELRQLLEIE